MAEAFNSLCKAELIRNKGPSKGIDDVEIALAGYIDRFDHRRLHGEIGMVPPVEYEQRYYSPAAHCLEASTPKPATMAPTSPSPTASKPHREG